MKPLTIDELKALEVGDWVWIVCCIAGSYAMKTNKSEKHFEYQTITAKSYLDYTNYGKTWLAYKNKEQAECKGKIVELPCILKSNSTYPKNQVVYINEFGTVIVERFLYEQDGVRRLAELKNKL